MMPTLKLIFRFLKPYTAQYLFGVIGMGVLNFFIMAYMAFVLGELTSSMVEMNMDLLVRTIFNVIILVSAASVLLWFAGIALVKSIIHVERDMRKAFFQKTLHIPLSVHKQYPSGELLSRFNNDLKESVDLFKNSFQTLSTMAFFGVGSTITIFILDWVMGLLVFGISSAIFILNLPILRKLRKASQNVQREKAGFLKVYTQLISGQRIIRYFNLGDWIFERIYQQSETLKKAGLRRNTLEVSRETLSEVTFWTILAVVIFGGFRAIEDPSYLSTMVAIVQLQNGVSFLFTSATTVFSEIAKRFAGVERLMEIVKIPEEPERIPLPSSEKSSKKALPKTEIPQGLSVERLSFTYPDSDKPVLESVSFEVEPGKTAAFVGPSGSGKTTLFKIMMGFYPPTSGRIRYRDKDLYDTPLPQWRDVFTYVPQDAFLFSGSIRDNLEVAMDNSESKSALSQKRLEEATHLSNAHDFIQATDSGYDTVLHEGGSNLSGGQRQRIALARAFLRNSPVLLLDEATSALDSESERIVQEAVSRLMSEKTALVIAHRLSTVRQADCIYYMEAGRIVEQGDHDTLMGKENGKYRAMVLAGELEEEEGD